LLCLSVFEIATQFNAIFRADANAAQLTAVPLLGMWLARRVHAFLNLLKVHLAATDDSAQLRDALEASVFFASSMGRLGAEFTPQLAPIFENCMHAIVVKPWKEGAVQLKETLTICSNAGIASPLVAHATAETDVSQAGEYPLDGPQPPPRMLMTLPPLGRFVNSVLTGVSACHGPSCVTMLTLLIHCFQLLYSAKRAPSMYASRNSVYATNVLGRAHQTSPARVGRQ
jgi:hypothetical protein